MLPVLELGARHMLLDSLPVELHILHSLQVLAPVGHRSLLLLELEVHRNPLDSLPVELHSLRTLLLALLEQLVEPRNLRHLLVQQLARP